MVAFSRIKYGVICLSTLAALWGLLVFCVPMFIDHQALRQRMIEELSAFSGQEVVVGGSDVSFSLYPKLHLYDVMIRNAPDALSPRLFSAQHIEITLDFIALLSGEFQSSGVSIEYAVLDIEEIHEGKWNVVLPTTMRGALSERLFSRHVMINHSRVNYTPYQAKMIYEYRDVSLELQMNKNAQVALDGHFSLKNTQYQLAIKGTDESEKQGKELALNVTAALQQDKESITYTGLLGQHATQFFANGTVAFALADVKAWNKLFDMAAVEEGLYAAVKNDVALNGEAIVQYQQPSFAFVSRDLQLNQQPLTLQGQFLFRDKTKFRLTMKAAALAMEAFDESDYTVDKVNSLLQKFLPPNAEGDVSLAVDSMTYDGIEGRDLRLSGTLLEEEFVINQASMKMGGDTSILLFGIFKQDANQKVNLDGNIEVIGGNIQEFLSAIDLGEHKFLANHKGGFRAKSNLFLSAALSMLSEFRFQAGTFLVEGGVQYRAEGPVHYTSSLRIVGGKLDSLARYINPTNKTELLESDYDTPKINLPWLRTMTHRHQLTLLFDDFELFGRTGRRSRFIVAIAPNKIALSSIDLNLETIKFTGDVSIDQSEKIPRIDGNFYLSELNVNGFVGHKFRRHAVERGNVNSVWSEKPLNVDFLKGYNGTFMMRFGEIIHDSFVVKDVNIDAVVEESAWEIKEFSGALWNGDILVKGDLDVSSIASVQMEFQLKGIFLHEFLTSTVGIDALRGKININGRIDTGGISVTNLVDNLTANIVLSGSDMVIKGFDVAGLIQALPNVRSSSEVANIVRVSLIGGQTTFRTIEGAFYVGDGKLKTHGLLLRSKHAIGTMTGEADLVTWSMDYGIVFRLPTIAMSEFPELTMYFRQSMDDPLIQVDTRALESFMTQRKHNR
jgi:hypothetical protein